MHYGILFFILVMVSGLLAWNLWLARKSSRAEREEFQRQIRRLRQEVNAHTQKDQALQQAVDHARSANEARSRYLSGISHELGTPLQTILGYAQLLSQNESIPEQSRASIHKIQRSADYLADLIEGVLDISRIEAGRLDIHRSEMDFHDFMAQLEWMFRPQAEAKGIEFIVTCPENLPRYVIVDEKRLRQILVNLLSNAIKFTHAGKVELALQYRNQVATFTVGDSGIGIARDRLETIFHPFERITSADQDHLPGTGLGLTIVHLLTDIMGGEVTVTSTPDIGSCFTVKLLLSQVTARSCIQSRDVPVMGYRGAPKTVLTVDDQASHRGLIRDLLAPLGFTVVEAADARSCLGLLNQTTADCFLLDVSLPDINGLKLAKLLRQRGFRQPIIMISAEAGESGSTDESELPWNFYMVKPFKIQSLLDKLAILMDIEWQYKDLSAVDHRTDRI